MTITTEEAERLARCGLDLMDDPPCRDDDILIDAGDLADMATAIQSLAAERDALRAENASLQDDFAHTEEARDRQHTRADRLQAERDALRTERYMLKRDNEIMVGMINDMGTTFIKARAALGETQ
jgi:hypothetical protein